MKTTKLSAETLADLARSGLTEKDAAELKIYDLTAEEMRRRFGAPVRGYAIPYNTGFERAKLLEEWQSPSDKKPRKYMQQYNSKPELYFPTIGDVDWINIKNDVKHDLFITEGEKKSAAVTKAGLPCIAISGVWCWLSRGKPLAGWEEIKFSGRQVFIVFDSDLHDKPEIQQAERELAAFLSQKGAIVRRISIPHLQNGNGKTGVDDLLVANGFPKKVKQARKILEARPKEVIDITDKGEHLTDLGNSRRLVRHHAEDISFVPPWRKWIIYTPKTGTWKIDDDGEIMRRAKDTVGRIFIEARKEPDEEKRKKIHGWQKSSESEYRLRAMITLASSEPGMAVMPDGLDRDSWSLTAADGTVIDLRSATSRPAHPEDYLVKSIAISVQPNAICPTWEKFLREIMANDEELISFIRRAVGYTLTGSTREQSLFLLWGGGANGKSTFLKVLLELLGGYGMQCAADTLMVQARGGAIRNDIARLRGARLIATSEVDEGQRFAESFIKQWTGEDPIVARMLYGEPFQFPPIGKIWMAMNHKPLIRGNDNAIWRRIRLIPFTVTFSPERQDKELSEKLRRELPGILNWALRGCAEWQEKGLQPPKKVTSATQEYRSEMDAIGAWIKESCNTGSGKTLISTLYNDYKSWCENNGEWCCNKRLFSQKLEEREFEKIQTSDRVAGAKGWFFMGITLVPVVKKY